MGQSPSSENYTSNSDDLVLVQGNADLLEGQVIPRVWTKQITRLAEKGDIILTVRAPVGDVGKTSYNAVIGRGVAAIRGNDFIFQFLKKLQNSGYWNSVSTGSTFDSINSNELKSTIISIPKIEEQKLIGDFFSNVDNLITLHQRKFIM